MRRCASNTPHERACPSGAGVEEHAGREPSVAGRGFPDNTANPCDQLRPQKEQHDGNGIPERRDHGMDGQ